jgi:hypothetical protein
VYLMLFVPQSISNLEEIWSFMVLQPAAIVSY